MVETNIKVGNWYVSKNGKLEKVRLILYSGNKITNILIEDLACCKRITTLESLRNLKIS